MVSSHHLLVIFIIKLLYNGQVYSKNNTESDFVNICIFLKCIKTNLLRYVYLKKESIDTVRFYVNCISGLMVRMLASSVVDRGFKSQMVQTKDYKIVICCFSAKHTALRRKSKDNGSEWGNMSISTIEIQLSVLVQYKAEIIIISLKINLFS